MEVTKFNQQLTTIVQDKDSAGDNNKNSLETERGRDKMRTLNTVAICSWRLGKIFDGPTLKLFFNKPPKNIWRVTLSYW